MASLILARAHTALGPLGGVRAVGRSDTSSRPEARLETATRGAASDFTECGLRRGGGSQGKIEKSDTVGHRSGVLG